MGSRTPCLLIDADIILHKVACVTEQFIEWPDEITTAQCSLSDAATTITNTLYNLVDTFDGADFKLVASSKENFRKELWPDYKGHRTQRKPVGFGMIKGWMQKQYGLIIVPKLEADDVIGIMATSEKYKNAIMVSTDKDFNTIPGTRYNPDTGETETTNEYAANRNHIIQTMIGDQADGYKGCPGVGKVKAEQILENKSQDQWWDAVKTVFEAKGLTEEDALLNARMARILRREDWDVTKKEPKLWEPTALATRSSTASGAESVSKSRVGRRKKQRSAA